MHEACSEGEGEPYLYHECVGEAVIESGIRWERLRAPPIDTSYDLHISNCLNDFHPGDHMEIQWRKKDQVDSFAEKALAEIKKQSRQHPVTEEIVALFQIQWRKYTICSSILSPLHYSHFLLENVFVSVIATLASTSKQSYKKFECARTELVANEARF